MKVNPRIKGIIKRKTSYKLNNNYIVTSIRKLELLNTN